MWSARFTAFFFKRREKIGLIIRVVESSGVDEIDNIQNQIYSI